MNIITDSQINFDTILKTMTNQFVIDTIDGIKNLLEAIDLALFPHMKDNYDFIHFKKRSILTKVGLVTFKRRYYRHKKTKKYIFALDSKLQIPKRNKIADEIKLEVLDRVKTQTYSNAGKNISYNKDSISKSTVYRVIKTASIKTTINTSLKDNDSIVHVQVDEKFVHMRGFKNKKKLYTATIFKGIENYEKEKHKLCNRVIISHTNLDKLVLLINKYLINKFKLDDNNTIYLSGDFATYIQNMPSKIICSLAQYVPDLFHVKYALREDLGLIVSRKELQNKELWDNIIEHINKNGTILPNTNKLIRAYENNNSIFNMYTDSSYNGCSQEAMNSHFVARRFGKLFYKFLPETVNKISSLINAQQNNDQTTISFKTHYAEELDIKIDIGYPLSFEEKDWIDKTNYGTGLRKLLYNLENGYKIL